MAQLRDLIVTGAARFLNNIYGNLIGNASSADKVNHRLTITVGGSTQYFDGSVNRSLTIDETNLNITDMVRLIGVVNQTYTTFSDGDNSEGGIVTNSTTVTSAGITQHAIFLSEVYSQECGARSGSVGSSTITYYQPKKGDLVLYDEQEYLCVAADTTKSTWRALDSSGYWKKYS